MPYLPEVHTFHSHTQQLWAQKFFFLSVWMKGVEGKIRRVVSNDKDTMRDPTTFSLAEQSYKS